MNDAKIGAMEHLYYYQKGLSTLQSLQQKQINDLIMSIHAPEIPAPAPAFGVGNPICEYKEAFMDGYMAAVDYFIKNELDRIEPKDGDNE